MCNKYLFVFSRGDRSAGGSVPRSWPSSTRGLDVQL